ncbi:hypothetical protein [Nonomuraea typhae]|uniref:hypothetical protein n=1 Tax=Nonomuraea typhae TaxID=2603600 RepID=UPI0012F7CE7C|nr:hypothetical protein [Nonomuraea typhae]
MINPDAVPEILAQRAARLHAAGKLFNGFVNNPGQQRIRARAERGKKQATARARAEWEQAARNASVKNPAPVPGPTTAPGAGVDLSPYDKPSAVTFDPLNRSSASDKRKAAPAPGARNHVGQVIPPSPQEKAAFIQRRVAPYVRQLNRVTDPRDLPAVQARVGARQVPTPGPLPKPGPAIAQPTPAPAGPPQPPTYGQRMRQVIREGIEDIQAKRIAQSTLLAAQRSGRIPPPTGGQQTLFTVGQTSHTAGKAAPAGRAPVDWSTARKRAQHHQPGLF